MVTREEIETYELIGSFDWCPWCKATKGMPEDCDYCFRTETLLQVEVEVEIEYAN